jgi:hypothetical protein
MLDNLAQRFQGVVKLASCERLTDDEREAVEFALIAVSFALSAARANAFREYVTAWPGTLTPEEEARIADAESHAAE